MLQKIQDAIDAKTDISEEIEKMLVATTDEELVMLAHAIIAKHKVRNDVICEIMKTINEAKSQEL
jgi:hypothetical protein